MNWKIILPLSVVLIACEGPSLDDKKAASNESPNDLISVINPIEGTTEAPRIFNISATKANTIELGNGGSIEIPENAFVDKSGNPVKGTVDLAWQEFHTLGDIMLSGIPMKYDSAGVEYNLVSGGMFTINASQKGMPVEIAPSKKVNVNMASIQDTPCYNFYEIDEKTGAWNYETTKVGTPIEQEKTEVAAAPSKPDLLDVNLNAKAFPELANLDIVSWEVKRKLTTTEKSILKQKSTKLRLIKTDSLGLTLEAKLQQNKTMQYPVAPYTLDQAMADSKVNKKELDKSLAETRDFVREMAAGRVIRSIEIDNFGTYNWDICGIRETSKKLMANFNFPSDVDPALVSLFLLSPDENAIIRYEASGDSKFSFDPNLKNCLIAILPGNKIVSVSNDGFATARSLKQGSACDFNFKETGIKLKSSKDIMNHMNALI